MINVNNGWQPFMDEQYQQDYYKTLRGFLAQAYQTRVIYPAADEIFSAYRATPPEAIRVVVLGQDPYHQPGQAHGMAFSVKPGVPLPPSLKNIYREITDCCGVPMSQNGYLMPWAQQGVFLLNTCLTVEQGRPNSHAGKGWETLTDRTIAYINTLQQPVVYLLWGRNARSKQGLITNPAHLVLQAPHPSPLSASAGFFGCRHFALANQYLQQNGLPPIQWQL